MPSIINTNVASLNAQRNLDNSQASLATALQRLSSGLRINSAKDDAAGLSIAERFTSQIRGNTQAARNANDGISLAQTAEGDLVQIGNNLQRIRELAVQSANATNSASDRAALQSEANQLISEIDRVASNSSFNGVKLLDGSFTAQQFQVGANGTSNDRVTVNAISSARTSQLGGVGSTTSATVTSGAATAALSAGDLTLNGQQVGASVAGASPGQSTASAFSIATAINAVSASSGVTATANATTVTGAAATVFTAIAANTFSVNGVNVGAVAAGTTAAGQGANLAAAVNAVSTQTGVTASANATTGAVTLTAADGRDINIGLNGAAANAATAITDKATFLTQTGLTTGTVGTQAASAVAGSVITAGAFATPPFAGGSLAAGAITANGASVGAVTYGTGAFTAATAAVAAAAGTTLTVSGLTAGSTYNLTFGGTGNTGSISFVATGVDNTDAAAISAAFDALGAGTLNGAANVLTSAGGTFSVAVTSVRTAAQVSAGVTSAQATIAATSAIATSNAAGFTVSAGTKGTQASNGAAYSGQQFAIALNNALTAATGGAAVNGSVTSSATTGQLTYVAGTTNSLQFAIAGTATDPATAVATQTSLIAQTGLTSGQLGVQAVTATNVANHGTVTLNSTNAAGIVVGGAAVGNAGLSTGTTAATTVSSVSAISALDISTVSGANAALSSIDGALTTVNSARATLGAVQNRFASTIASLQTTVENLTASRSRIQDADFAQETAALSRSQILQQAGTAILAQANASSNGVLALLR